MKTALLVWTILCLTLATASPHARAQGLRVDKSDERMRVDGALREWQGARFVTLGSGDDSALRYALATADDGFYLGAEVTDERLIQKPGLGAGQDVVVLSFAMPTTGGTLRVTEVALFPGANGKKARAAIAEGDQKRRAAPGVRVVEGPRPAGVGYVIEAFIPFAAIAGAEIWEQGRAAIRFEDVDGAGKKSVLSSTSATHAQDFPRLLPGTGHQDFLGNFLRSKGLSGVDPRFDFRGQVSGDARAERVVIVDKYALVYGPGYARGESFGFLELPYGLGGGLKTAQLMDVTGDGRAELVTQLRQRNELGARLVWMAFTFEDERPRPLFGFELRKEVSGGFIEGGFDVRPGKGKTPATFVVSRGRASGVDATSYQESRAVDLVPILLPWEDISTRRYRFNGAKLAMIDEKRDPSQARADEPPAPAAARTRDEPQVVIEPTVEAVLSLFKQERGLAAGARPSRQLRGNLLGGAKPEQLFVFGTTLVIVGPEVGQGGGYIAYGLPVERAADLRHVGLADVTSDGRAEVFVRIRQPLGGAEGVFRGVMLVHSVDAQRGFKRVLSVEAFRYQGDKRIANHVRTRGGQLVVEPGVSVGWDAQTFPFTDEEVGGVGRLLLPWKDEAQRYRLRGDTLVPR